MSVTILLLAAGASSRMRGADKLLERLEGEPLLRRSARAALASRADETLVVLGANRPDRQRALAGLPIRVVANKNWREGMGASIAAGVVALAPRIRAVMILPADMPDITPALLDMLIAALPPDAPGAILRPRMETGIPGNPVLFGADHLPALAGLNGDAGARAVIDRNPAALRYIETGDTAVLTDLDTPEAWAAYRAARGDRGGS